jgi:hypothetical protein
VWFELHDFARWSPQAEYRQWLRERPVVYMHEASEEFPGSQRFPIEAIKGWFGTEFLNGSASMILAYAIMQSPPQLGTWGIHGVDDRGHQLPGLQHFLRLAEAMGIEVVHHCGVLRKMPVYGYDYHEPAARWPCGIDDIPMERAS